MRRIILPAVLVLLLWPTVSSARNTDRCWLSLGVVGGPAVFTEPELKDEFNIPVQFELELKYYLWKPFSIAGTFGYLYGEGRPLRAEWHQQWVNYDGHGVSFWRGYTFGVLGRIEIGRYWRVNPYLGGGFGGAYNSVERSGKLKGSAISDSNGEYVFQYPTLVGFDFLLNKVIAIRLEGRWTFMPTNDSFTDERRFDFWSALIGLQFYF